MSSTVTGEGLGRLKLKAVQRLKHKVALREILKEKEKGNRYRRDFAQNVAFMYVLVQEIQRQQDQESGENLVRFFLAYAHISPFPGIA
jgi:hypothetical protein